MNACAIHACMLNAPRHSRMHIHMHTTGLVVFLPLPAIPFRPTADSYSNDEVVVDATV